MDFDVIPGVKLSKWLGGILLHTNVPSHPFNIEKCEPM